MLRAKGAETQKKRRIARAGCVLLGRSERPGQYCTTTKASSHVWCAIYAGLKPLLRQKAYLTIIVKNVKKGGRIYPLAWDLGRELGKVYTLKDEKLWLQDNQRLAPYGLGSAWVSNTFHHYCLQFRNE